MDVLFWLIHGVLPALAAVLLGVGVGGPRLLALSLAVAVCVPCGLSIGWPAWPWQLSFAVGESRQWLFWCLAGAGVVGAAYDLKLLPRPLLFVGEVLVVLAVPWFVSAPLRVGWTFEKGAVWLSLGWASIVVLWWVLRGASKVAPGLAVPLVGTLALTADALLLYRSGPEFAWNLAGVAAVALGVAVATTIWRRPFVCGTGGTLCITILHVGLLWNGRSERELQQLPFLLALLVPLPLWLPTTRVFAPGRATGVLVGVSAAAGLAVGAVLV